MHVYARAGTNAHICLYVHTCMYEYVYAYMNERIMRAYERAGAHALVCPSGCLSVCMYIPICMYNICMCVSIYTCMCVRLCVCIYVCPLLFFLPLTYYIFVGLLAYMRTHASQHLK